MKKTVFPAFSLFALSAFVMSARHKELLPGADFSRAATVEVLAVGDFVWYIYIVMIISNHH